MGGGAQAGLRERGRGKPGYSSGSFSAFSIAPSPRGLLTDRPSMLPASIRWSWSWALGTLLFPLSLQSGVGPPADAKSGLLCFPVWGVHEPPSSVCTVCLNLMESSSQSFTLN